MHVSEEEHVFNEFFKGNILLGIKIVSNNTSCLSIHENQLCQNYMYKFIIIRSTGFLVKKISYEKWAVWFTVIFVKLHWISTIYWAAFVR